MGQAAGGITGSAGKTTTKEAIAHVLATRFRVLKSEGNFNNHFGLPLMLLKLEREHDIAVIEMGMSHAGEIAALAKIAQPEIGVVTNVAPVHLEFFDSIAEIARAKYELIESFPRGGQRFSTPTMNTFRSLAAISTAKLCSSASGQSADVRAENITPRGAEGSSFDVVVGGCREDVLLPLVGAHNIHNALAAVAVALERGLSPSDAVDALASLTPADKRGQVVQVGNIAVVNDCYNSNPKALEAMVDALAEMPAKRRIVVAGEMLELGPAGGEMHRRSGQHHRRKRIDVVIGVRGLAQQWSKRRTRVGNTGRVCRHSGRSRRVAGARNSRRRCRAAEGSRGVKLEKALETLEGAVVVMQPAELTDN